MEKDEEKWISLKEASKISGYAPDYIGELIRKGKIPGKQVVCNVAWMTTKEAILAYKERQKRGEVKKLSKKEKFSQFLEETKRKILLQFEILKLFFNTFKSIFVIFLILILIIFTLFFYLFSSIQRKTISKESFPPQIEKIEGPTF